MSQSRQATTQSNVPNQQQTNRQPADFQNQQQFHQQYLPQQYVQPSGIQQFQIPSQLQYQQPTQTQLYQGSIQQLSGTTQVIQQQEGVQSYQGVITNRKQYFFNFYQQTIKGESRIEYVPYQREVVEYVTQEVVEYVPREKKVTDYYAVEYTTEYVPQVYQEKYIEYVPVEQVRERVEYQAIQKQSVIQQPTFAENTFAQQYVQQQPYVTASYSGQAYTTPVIQGTTQYTGQQFIIQGASQSNIPGTTKSNIPSQLPPATTVMPTSGFAQTASIPTQFVGSPNRGLVGASAYQGNSYYNSSNLQSYPGVSYGSPVSKYAGATAFPSAYAFPPQTFPGTTTGYPGNSGASFQGSQGILGGYYQQSSYGGQTAFGGLQAPASGAPNSLFPSTQQQQPQNQSKPKAQ